MICSQCQTDNAEWASVCFKCGKLLEDHSDADSPELDVSATIIDDPSHESLSGLKTTIIQSEIRQYLTAGSLFANRYEILDKGKAGGMGVVYKVMDRELSEVVALKVMHPDFLKNNTALGRFKQEVKIARSLQHPNLVRVYDLGESDNIKYFTMEYIEGKTLRQLLDRREKDNKPFSLEETVDIISQLCEVLHYAHGYTIHRDIKPENILMMKNEEVEGYIVKVTDFGLAKMATPSMLSVNTKKMGTPYYMAPEQLKDSSKVDKRADIYSLGVILYELLTLSLPLGRFETLRVKRPDVPPSLDPVVDKALEPVIGNRFSDALELKDALNSAIKISEDQPVEDTPVEEKETVSQVIPEIQKKAEKPVFQEKAFVERAIQHPKPQKKKNYMIPVLVGLFLALVVSIYVISNLKEKEAPPTTASMPSEALPSPPAEEKGPVTAAPPSTGNQVQAKTAIDQEALDRKVEGYIGNAKNLLANKKYDSALIELEKALKIDSRNVSVYKLQAEIETEKKISMMEAQKRAEEARRIQNEITQYSDQGIKYFNQGKFTLCIEKMKEVIKRDSNNVVARGYIARAQNEIDKVNQAWGKASEGETTIIRRVK